MTDNCNDRVVEITPPDIPDDPGCSNLTKEQILGILGYEEIEISKTDSEDNTVTITVPGAVDEGDNP